MSGPRLPVPVVGDSNPGKPARASKVRPGSLEIQWAVQRPGGGMGSAGSDVRGTGKGSYPGGRLLATWRHSAGLSQCALSDRLGVTQAAVSEWELSKSAPLPDVRGGCPVNHGTTLGIDPGYASCGWAILSGSTPAATRTGVITTKPGPYVAHRVQEVYHELFDLVEEWKPGIVAVEAWDYQGPRSHGPQGYAISQLIGRLQGLAEQAGARFVLMTTSEIKRALGCRDKMGVRLAMAVRGYRAKADHEVDAIAAAVVGQRKLELEGRR